MELWYTEKQTENTGITCKVRETLHTERTPFQDLAMIETIQFGRMLVLDGMVQTTEVDEFVYHEMITHIAMATHPNPRAVGVIGGGDGGTIREVIKHPSVERAVLIEIDGRVVEVSKQYLPSISSGLSDPRVEVRIEDGLKHVKERKGTYDVLLVDSTEPVGAAIGLFSPEFYRNCFEALREDGILVAQTESPFFNKDLIQRSFKAMSQSFPITRLYLAAVPTYPSGLWSFTIGSTRLDPVQADTSRMAGLSTKYYTPELHVGAFQLPRFVADLIKEGAPVV